jgi:hypothetical protein
LKLIQSLTNLETTNMKFTKSTDYSVNTKYDLNYEPLYDLTNVDHFKNGENLYAVSLKITETKEGHYTGVNKTKWSRIINKEHLEAIISSPDRYLALEQNFLTDTPISLVKPIYLSEFSQYGLDGNLANILDEKKSEHTSVTSTNFLKDGKTEEYKFIQYIPNDNCVRAWIDSDGVKYCNPFVMDYIYANLNNKTYHLDELVEHLSERDDVGFLINKSYSHRTILKCPLKDDEPYLNKIIEDIPHYNAEEDNDECITLVYYPKGEAIEQILNWTTDNDKVSHNVDDFIVREILGGNKFLKNPTIASEIEIPKRKFKK